jgi:long-chain acyl-CoA synthetase
MEAGRNLQWPAMSIDDAHGLLTSPGAAFEIEQIQDQGALLAVWKHAPKTLTHLLERARRYSTRDFLVADNQRLTYASFFQRIDILASLLRMCGVTPGERIAIVLPNSTAWPVAFFAVCAAGGIAVLANHAWTGREIEFALLAAGATTCILDRERFERLGDQARSRLRTVFVTDAGMDDLPGGASCQLVGWPDDTGIEVSQKDALPPLPHPAPNDAAAMFFTSGTTGVPKGVVVSHRSLLQGHHNTSFARARAQLLAGAEMQNIERDNARQRVLGAFTMPFHHVAGCVSVLLPAVYMGAKLVTTSLWSPVAALQLIEAEKIMAIAGTPLVAQQLVSHPNRADYDLSSLLTINYGGAPSSENLPAEIRNALQANAVNSWGMTETCSAMVSHVGRECITRPASCGLPAPIAQIRIVNPQTEEDEVLGSAGELWVRGAQMFLGYWDPEKQRVASPGGDWFRTGDLAHQDEIGYVYIVDRIKDIIIRAGENIYSIEVENALLSHADVAEAAVFGIEDPVVGQEPVAVVVGHPGVELNETALRAFARERLAPFKIPRRVFVWNEPLPRNAAGKVLKNTVRTSLKL